jgi:hypothetical protein
MSPKVILSLGAGVQSTAIALMAMEKKIFPMPDAAIFADTGAEPRAVYKHLEWIKSVLSFPLHIVGKGDLKEEILDGMKGKRRIDGRPPFFTAGGGMVNRQCTADYKIGPIIKKVRELIGLEKGQMGPKYIAVEQWIGISTDEAQRMKDSRFHYIKNRFPLIELDMSRSDCLKWMEERGYPKPPKSACTFCPYHDNKHWRETKKNDPEAWAEALEVDTAIRAGMPGPSRPIGEPWFIHRSRVPLGEVDFSTAEERGQQNLWGNECEGMCGN